IEVGCCLFRRPAWLQASHDGEPPGSATVELAVIRQQQSFGANRKSDVEGSSYFYAEKTRGRNADDFDRAARKCQLASDHRRIASVLALPERMTYHRARRAASSLIVLGGKDAAKDRLDPQHIEEVAAHPQALNRTRLSARSQVEHGRIARKDSGECLLLISYLLPDRVCQRRAPGVEASAHAGFVFKPHLRKFLRASHRKRPQKHGIQQLEDRRIGSDPQSQGEYRYQGKAPVLSRHPNRIS